MLLSLEVESVWVVHGGAGLHAQQRVVGRSVAATGVVAVVGGQQGCSEVARNVDQRRIGPVLLGQSVVL